MLYVFFILFFVFLRFGLSFSSSSYQCLRVRFADSGSLPVVMGITELVVATKKPMSASEFCVGYQLMKAQPGSGSALPRFESLAIAP
jgi:hypothetical protein